MIPRKRLPWQAYTGMAILILLLLAVPLYTTSTTSFYARQKSFKGRYQSWRTSSHKTVSCARCHVEPGLANAVKYRITGVKRFYASLIFPAKSNGKLAKPSSRACRSCHDKTVLTKSNSRVPLIPHRIHAGAVGNEENCLECHKWLVHDEKFQKGHKSLPLTGVCFKYGCHGEVKPTVEECQACHHRESVPNADWRKNHRDVVNARGSNRCFDYCHKPDWCRSCHLTGEKAPIAGVQAASVPPTSTLISQHASKEWMKFHGQEALTSSKKCLACHANYQLCRNCHSIRPASHGRKETWLAQHQKPAKGNESGCLTCHQKRVCDRCHELFKETGR